MQVILVSLFLYSAQQPNNNLVIGNLTRVNTEEDGNGTRTDNLHNMSDKERGNGTRTDNSPTLNDEERGSGTRSDNSQNVNNEEHDGKERNTTQANLKDKDRFSNVDYNKMSKLDRWRNDLTYKVVIILLKMEGCLAYTDPSIETHMEALMESYSEFCEFLSDSALKIEKLVHRRYCENEVPAFYKYDFMLNVKPRLKSMVEKFKIEHNGLTLDEVWYKTINSTSEKIVLDLEAIDDIIGYLMEEAQLVRTIAHEHQAIRYYYEFVFREATFREKRNRMYETRKNLTNLKFFDSFNNTATFEMKSSVISKYKNSKRLDKKWRRYRAIIAHVGFLYSEEAAPFSSFASFSDNDPSNSTQKLISFWSNCNTELDSYPSFAKLVDTRPEDHNWLSNIREHANNNPIMAFSSISIVVIGLIALISIIFKKFTRRKRNYIPAAQIDDV